MSAVPAPEDTESRQPLLSADQPEATQFVVKGVPAAADGRTGPVQQPTGPADLEKNGANIVTASKTTSDQKGAPHMLQEPCVAATELQAMKERAAAKEKKRDDAVVLDKNSTRPRSLCGVWLRLGCWRLTYLLFATVATFVIIYVGINYPKGKAGTGVGEWFYALTFLLLAFLCPAAPKVAVENKGPPVVAPVVPLATKSVQLTEIAPPASKGEALAVNARNVVAKKPPAAAKPRLLFLDNLKVFLTLAVVFFHVSIGFGAWKWQAYTLTVGNHKDNVLGKALSVVNLVNQSYFMSLFFFISGFFVPSSLQRKGAVAFLEDKFMRLGIPLVLGGFVFFPLVTALSMQAAFGTDYGATNPDGTTPLHLMQNVFSTPDAWYIVGLGPLWFLMVLLLFNLAFCVLYPKGLESMPGDLPLPGFLEMLFVGSLFGLLQGWTYQDGWGWGKSGRFAFLEVPNMYGGGGGMPFDILFFFAGAFAKKNNWLEQIVEMSTASPKEGKQENDIEQGVLGDLPEVQLAAARARQRNSCSIWSFRLHALALVACIVALTVHIDPKLAPPEHSRCGHIQQDMAVRFAQMPDTYARLFPDLPMRDAQGNGWEIPAAAARPPMNPTPEDQKPWYDQKGWLQDQLLKGNSLFWHALRGQLSISLSFVMLQFFAQFGNSESPTQPAWNGVKKALGEGAYGVYLFHWMVWPLFLWMFLYLFYPSKILMSDEQAAGENLEFLVCADRMFAAKGPVSQPLMGVLFLLTLLATNLILWPACFYLRKIPGLDKVL
ncbi:unnamed protein product [Amoebophrya sp. A120]|nr:unnamed protein product [Amoebophrya sp. A120]|eukprot:GSA120T00012329001.1